MPAKYVIHTVGPIWSDGKHNEPDLLARAYRNCLKLASEYNCKTIAFPNISTGIFGFPKELAAEIAIREISAFLTNETGIEKIIFVCFEDENYQIYSRLLIKAAALPDSPSI